MEVMTFEPHGYQNYAIEYILDHEVCALFLDMGLGKTVSTLTAIDELVRRGEVRHVLVIAPLRVASVTWPQELRKWEHLSMLGCSLVLGNPKQREEALASPEALHIVNRENVPWLVDWYIEHRKRWIYDMVVIDELSSFKSWSSKRYKALRKVHPFSRRWVGLTGTPTSNGLMDLFAEIGVLDGGKRLGRFITGYREEFFRPDRYNPGTGVIYSYAPLPGAEEEIYSRISDMTVSMKARDHLEMPDLFSVTRTAYMDERERKAYDSLRRDMVLELDGAEVDAANAAALSLKLQQMANGAVYDEEGQTVPIHDRKLEVLDDLIEEANGQNVLVAYWFQHDRARILAHLVAGGMRPEEVADLRSDVAVGDWNAGRLKIGLIHPASAGHGLNLQEGGHILVWFGLTWSLELYQQTNARLYRQGQKDVVTIHHILCDGTVDARVMAALRDKDAGQERVLAAVKAELGVA